MAIKSKFKKSLSLLRKGKQITRPDLVVVTFVGGTVASVRRSAEFDKFSNIDVAYEEVDSIVLFTSLMRFVSVEQLSLE